MIIPALKTSFVQILKGNKVVGNGFLGPYNLIVTCAHVVKAAGFDPTSPVSEHPQIRVVFHWIEDKPAVLATLVQGGWLYEPDTVDLAILSLPNGFPDAAIPLRLATQEKQNFSAELEPYFPDLGSSRRIEALAHGIDDNGRLVLIPSDPSRQWIEEGASGSPVLAKDSELVEGLVMLRDVAVKQAFACPASRINKVLTSMIGTRTASNLPQPRQPSVVGDTQDFPKTVMTRISATPELLTADFLGADPVRGIDAIHELATLGPCQLRPLLRMTRGSRQHIIRMQILCARIGALAIPELIDAIRDGSWGEKQAAAPCFKVYTEREAGDSLYELLKQRDFDVLRLTIEAAGYCGYSSMIRWELCRLAMYDDMRRDIGRISEYSFGKLSSYVTEALARGFARSGDSSELSYLSDFMTVCSEQGQGDRAEAFFEKALEDLTPAAVDSLVAQWLPLRDGPNTRLALRSLAEIRLSRTAQPVVRHLGDARHDVSIEAGICLGSIGCDVAAQKLMEFMEDGAQRNSATRWAFSMLYARKVDWSDGVSYRDALLEGNSEIAAQMLVSAAQRDGDLILNRAQQGLSDETPFYRGASALAIAWARPKNAQLILSRAVDEASDELERLFVLSAQVLSGRRDCGRALNAALMSFLHWPSLRPFWRMQVLAALSISELDRRYQSCWAEVSRDNAPRTQAIIDDLANQAQELG